MNEQEKKELYARIEKRPTCQTVLDVILSMYANSSWEKILKIQSDYLKSKKERN